MESMELEAVQEFYLSQDLFARKEVDIPVSRGSEEKKEEPDDKEATWDEFRRISHMEPSLSDAGRTDQGKINHSASCARPTP